MKPIHLYVDHEHLDLSVPEKSITIAQDLMDLKVIIRVGTTLSGLKYLKNVSLTFTLINHYVHISIIDSKLKTLSHNTSVNFH